MMLYLQHVFLLNLVLSKATDRVVGKGICTIDGINNASRKRSYS